MNCKVEKNAKNGKINKVVDESGNESALFQQILNTPVLSLVEAIEIYKNAFNEDIRFPLAKEYTDRITAIKKDKPTDYWSVDIPSQEIIKKAAKEGRIVKNSGGMAIVEEDGNMIGLFKDKDVKGVAKDLEQKRIALGGIKKDNFDTYLTKIYEQNGFRVTSRVPFNEEYAKDLVGYNKKLHGTPDVVAMIYDPQGKLNIEEKKFTDYNEALAYRDSFVSEARGQVKFQIIGEKGAQNLDQIEEATFRMDNLKVAREMEAAGKSPKEVRLATGWERGADGLFGYEIDDNSATLNFNIDSKSKLGKKYNLESVLDYPELYKAFPKLKKIKISISKEGGSTTEGFFDGKQIVLGIDSYKLEELLKVKDTFSVFNALSKETKAIIERDVERERYSDILREQGVDFNERYKLLDEKYPSALTNTEEQALIKDGLASYEEETNEIIRPYLIALGQSTKRVVTNDKYYRISFDLRQEQRNNVIESNELGNINSILKPVLLHEIQHWIQKEEGFARGGNTTLAYMNLSEEDKIRYEALEKEKTDILKRLEKEGLKWYDQSKDVRDTIQAPNDFLYVKYKSISGEVQARNVEARMNMSAEERRQTLLEETEDVAREDQIFIMDSLGGSQMSFSPKKEFNKTATLEKLKETGLADNLFQLSTKELENKLIELGVSADIARQVVAYHGSPYYFDRFEFSDRTFLSAEGNAAFGAGLYFTDIESIAKDYASKLSKRTILFNGKEEMPTSLKSNPLITYIKKSVDLGDSKKQIISNLIKYKLSILRQNKATEIDFENLINYFNNNKFLIKPSQSNLYKVSLHKGKTPSEYTWLEWDKQTAKEVKEKFSNVIKNENLKGEIHNIKLSNKYDVESFDGGKTWKVGDTTKIGTEEEFVATFKDKKEAEKEAYKLNFVESNITGKDLYEALAKQIGQKEASLFLLENGIDGIKYPAESLSRGATSDTARGFNYVVFDENAITIEEQIQFNKSGAIKEYYSNAQEALTNLKDKNPKNVKGWISQLTDTQKNGGIKNVNQELDWIGLEEYLNDYVKENNPKAGNISASVVEDYIQSNQIEIVDITKTEDGTGTDESVMNDTKYAGYQLKGAENYREVLLTMPDVKGKKRTQELTSKISTLQSEYNKIYNTDIREAENELIAILTEAKDTKYGIMPTIALLEKDGNTRARELSNKKVELQNKADVIQKEIISTQDEINKISSNSYSSSHWSEKNILAHVRLNEKTLPDGRRVLILNEIQSDSAEDIKKEEDSILSNFVFKDKEGKEYKNPSEKDINEKSLKLGVSNLKTLNYLLSSLQDSGVISMKDVNSDIVFKEKGYTHEEFVKVLSKRENISYEIRKAVNKNTVPNFTAHKQTDRWVGIAFRRMLKLASDEGYDGIALATGQQSADMYSLSQQVNRVVTEKVEEADNLYFVDIKVKNGTDINLEVENGIVRNTQEYKEKTLESIIGKELSKNILSSKSQTIQGKDLEIGGEGMKTFYDKIVTKVAQKEAQRFDKNAKLETIDFSEQPLRVEINEDGNRILVDYTGEVVDAQYGSRFTTDQEYIDAFKDAYNNSKGVTVNKEDKLSLGIQPYIAITDKMKSELAQKGIPLFSKSGITPITNGFIYKNDVYLNKDTATEETFIHEFSHLYNRWLKENRPEVYKRGLSLIEAELEKSPITTITKTTTKEEVDVDDSGIEIFENVEKTDFNINFNNGARAFGSIKENTASLTQINSPKGVKGNKTYERVILELSKNGVNSLQITLQSSDSRATIKSLLSRGILTNPRNLTGVSTDQYPTLFDISTEKISEEVSEIQDIIDFVKLNQPSLTGEALLEEILTQLTGIKGLELLLAQKESKSGIINWISEVWQSIKELLGLSSYTDEQILNMNLKDFANASAIDLLRGEVIKNGNSYDSQNNDIRYQIIGEKGASRVSEYQQSLSQAKELEKQGISLQEVENQTGWYKHKGIWKTLPKEVLESFSVRNNTKDKVLKLKDVLDEGNKIFEFYPELNNTKVVFVGKGVQGMEMPENFENGNGVYDETSGNILINTVYKGVAVGDREQKYALAHEIQHTIQKLEQHPRGGHSESILDEAMGILSIKSERLIDIFNEIKNADKSKLTENEKLIVEVSLETIMAIDSGNISVLKNQYKHILGEIDANVVEGALKVKDSQNIIVKSYSELLNIYVQWKKIDMNSIYLLKNGSVRFSIIGQKGASKIEEYSDLLNQAKTFEKQGKDYSQTGWFKNEQGQWKYFSNEILNEFLDFPQIKNKTVNLKDLLKKDSILLKAYPELENTKIEFYEGTEGSDFRANPEISGTVTQAGTDTILYIRTDSKITPDTRRTVAHELNHKIQSIEDFSRGGSPESFLKFSNQITGIELTSDFQDYKNKMLSFDINTLNREDKGIVKVMQDYLKNDRSSKDYFYKKYLLLQGEIDSRAVELAITLKDTYGRQQNLTYSALIKALAINENNPSIIDQAIDLFYEDTSNSQKQTAVEPKATFNGFNTYSEAVKNTPTNESIKIDINGINVSEITNNGDINDLIRQDIILDERELTPSGDIIFTTAGNSLTKKLINAEIAKEVIKGRVNEDGNIVAKEKVELTKVSEDFNKNKKEFGQDTAIAILATQILKNNTPVYGNNRIVDYSIEVPNDTVLMTKLKNLLQELGIKTMSLEGWAESYKKRTGETPTPNALADIANRVIAFANGEVSQDALTEEVMHFVVEALPQEQIQPLLDMVHKTDEWKQYAAQYTEIYKDDNIVRREILGKVLKNYIQSQQEQSTLQGQSVVRRLLDMVEKFFNQIRGLFKPQHQVQLDKFKEDIFQKLMKEELYSELSPEQFDGNSLVMYQAAPSTIYDYLTKTLESFESLDRKTGGQNKFETSLLNVEDRDELSQLRATAGLSAIIKTKIKHLIKRGKQSGFLSVEEQLVYDVALNELAPTLGKLKNIIAEKPFSNTVLKKAVLDDVTETMTALSELSTALNEDNVRVFDTLVEDVASQTGLTPEMTEILKNEIKTLQRDTNQFYSLYGSLSHAQSPILNILSTVISDAERESIIQYDKRQSEFINAAKALGFKEEQIADELKKFKDGYYFISQWDFEAIEKEKAVFKVDAYNEVAPKAITMEEFLKEEQKLLKKLPQKLRNTYNFKVKEKIDRSGMHYDRLTKEERAKADSLIEGFSEKTKRFLADQAKRKGAISQRISDNGGASKEDNNLLKELAQQRQRMANPYTEYGSLHKGLYVNIAGEVSKDSTFDDSSTTDLDREIATTILELAEYNKKIVAQYKDREALTGKELVPQNFIDKIQKMRGVGDMEGVEKATEFILMNTRISYNSNFWDSFEKTNGLIDKLRESTDPKAIETADNIQRSRIRLKNILKEHRDYNNPSQIDYENLGGAEATIKEISSDLEHLYEKAKNYVKDEEIIKKATDSESITNRAYKDVIKDRGIEEVTDRKTYEAKLEFILKHVTSKNRDRIVRNAENFISYKKGVRDNMPKSLEKFHTRSVSVNKFEENVEVYQDILDYAESLLLPYFKELKPTDFSMQDFIAELAKAKTEAEFNTVIDQAKFISVTPSYSLVESEDNKRLNPLYAKAYEANEPTINLDYKGGILRNKNYKEMFAPDANGNATKNVKQKQLLDLTVAFWSDSIESANMTDKFNKFQLPGIRRGSLARKEQLIKNFSGKNLKESIKDIITVREEDPIFGQTADMASRGTLTIPRIGFSKLETADEVTDELLYSLMHTANQAEKTKQRVSSLDKIEAVKTRLRGATYGDKSGESTEAYKMADDFIRYNIYGQTETFKWETDFFGITSKKYNLAPAIKHFQSWTRLVGLGYSTLVPLTSFLQGSTNFLVENIVGDRINKTASRLAAKKAGELVSKATKEEFMSDLKTKSELNLLMQFFGLSNPAQKFANSNYGKALRGLVPENSAYFSHFMGQVPLNAQVIMTVLYDFKVVEDTVTKEKKLQSYSEWRNDNKALRLAGSQIPVTEGEAMAEWKLNDKYLYNYIKTIKDSNGEITGMEMNDEYNTIFAGKERYANERLNFVKRKISTVIQEVDNQIPNEDKALIQRHAIWSFVSMFKGFLITSINKRFKDRHRSLQTNQLEEGTYKGTSAFLGALVNSGRKGSFKDFWKEQYREFDGGYKLQTEGNEYAIYDTNKDGNPEIYRTTDKAKADNAYAQLKVQATQMRQVSLKRAGLDFAVTASLATMALLLKGIADDDEDDDYTKEFMAYMSYRLAVETTSQSLGLPGQMYSFIQSPTAGLSQINNLINIGDLGSGEIINRGTYRDYSEREALLYRSIPVMKEYFRLKEIDRSRQDYKRYNKHFIDNFNFAALMFDEESRK